MLRLIARPAFSLAAVRAMSSAVTGQPAAVVARVAKPAPHFKVDALVGDQFKTISLSDYKGKYVCLVFYPLDWTFVCPTEILAHNDCADEFAKRNAEVMVVSTDSKFSHHAWANAPRKEGGLHPMKIPMLADVTRTISAEYGCLHDDGFNLRGTYIIDGKGILRHITINDRPVGRSVDEALRLIDAFQYADTHGEVCPADWKVGGATIKGDVVAKKQYFGSKYK